jgi:hypothetical protein
LYGELKPKNELLNGKRWSRSDFLCSDWAFVVKIERLLHRRVGKKLIFTNLFIYC